MPKKANHELVVPTKLAPVDGSESGLSTIDVLDGKGNTEAVRVDGGRHCRG